MTNAPINYSGNKFKLLPQLLRYIPSSNNMVDLFCGGCCVGLNSNSTYITFNDINKYLIELYNELYKTDKELTLNEIDGIVSKYNLNGYNREGFNELRNEYNKSHNPIMLYVLIVNSFNDQIRFNNKGEFNSSFREGRFYNESRKKKLSSFIDAVKSKNVEFVCNDFRDVDLDRYDFIYADPPYNITCATYNDGKRGFNGWTRYEDLDLFDMLDYADKNGIKFALSNVFTHDGNINNDLLEWSKKYNIISLDIDNKNSSNYKHIRNEVLITNYEE